jgi:ribose 5-phosphate isomerase B
MEMIAIGNDHTGYEMKKIIIAYLEEKGLEYKDFGCGNVTASDYPEYAKAVGKAIQNKECDRGILICGTGIGMSMAANKMKGIRAALCHDCFSAEATRLHNDANILVMGARVIGTGHALKIVDIFLNTEFSGAERHMRRIHMLDELESAK